MSIREVKFCDFKAKLIGGTADETTCSNPAVGTCALCRIDYCSSHSVSDNALSISVGIACRTPGSGQIQTKTVVQECGPMCETCTKSFEANGGFQRATVQAARDAAVKALAAMQVEQALAATEPHKI
jgi:hypothetical protein